LSLFEWTLQKVVLHVLDPHFGRSRRQHARRRPAGEDVAIVLSALAHAGGDGDDAIRFAFERGVEATGLKSLSLQQWDRAMFKRLDQSLDALS